MKYLVACSGGNDSLALIQHMLDNYAGEFGVVYNNTGWAQKGWDDRIAKLFDKLNKLGVATYETKSIGMPDLVRKKKGWPMPASKMQFCTSFLKEQPTLELLDVLDPHKDIIICTGRRREESRNRAALPLLQPESDKHGGRDVFNPLINVKVEERNSLIEKFGEEVLPHQSRECYPCVCANKKDISGLDPDTIIKVKNIEIELGHTSKGKPRVMFRPYRTGNSVGIEEVYEWSKVYGYKSSAVPSEYQIPGVDYSAFTKGMTSGERKEFWEDILRQATELGWASSSASKELDEQLEVPESRQCDGGYCDGG